MGRCHDFGVQVGQGCGHPMQARENACVCPQCEAVCEGQFNGCPDVWARGPRPVQLAMPTVKNDHVNGDRREVPLAPTSGVELVLERQPADETSESRIQAEARSHLLQWVELSVTGMRSELHALASEMGRQHAMLNQLLEARQAERRQTPLTESVPQVLKTAMADASTRQRTELAEALAAMKAQLDDELHALRASAAESRQQVASDASLMRSEVRRSLDELQGAVDTARADQARSLVATNHALSGGKSYIEGSLKQLRETLAELQAAAATRDQDRQEVHDELRRLGESFPEMVAASVSAAVEAAERRTAEWLETVVDDLERSLIELQATTAAQHGEVRDELARQWRSAKAALSRQRHVTDSLPELVTAAVRAAMEASVEDQARRLEAAVEQLYARVEEAGAAAPSAATRPKAGRRERPLRAGGVEERVRPDSTLGEDPVEPAR
jgi:hypothetical protein